MGLERKEQTLQVNIRARMGKPQDAGAILSLLAKTDPGFPIEDKAKRDFFADLIEAEMIRAGCIELQQRDGTWELGAAGVSAFLDDVTAQSWLDAPQPHFADVLLESAFAGSPVFLSQSQAGRANAEDGLNLFILGFSYAFPPGSPLVPPVLTRAIEHFVSSHQGYRLKRLMREDPAPIAEMFQRSGMRTLATFHFQNESGEPLEEKAVSRVATVMERSDTMPLFPHSPAAMLFQFLPPVIGFSPSERRMLQLALEGLSDHDLARELSISPHTLKRCWRTIFDRSLLAAPLIFGSCAEPRDTPGVRGQEKRRHLLQYLREHPQELRPFDHRNRDRSRPRASSIAQRGGFI